MSYYAYFLGKTNPARPITFIYNGGPNGSAIWLHMGAFGPKRVVTAEDYTPGAYRPVDNEASLLPESDLVFIDAPSRFGHLRGADKERRSLASTRRPRSPILSRSSSRGTGAEFAEYRSAKVTTPRVRRFWPTSWRAASAST